VARNVSPGFVRTSQSTAALCQDAADAITAARGLPGQVATLILPADVSWGEGGVPCPPPPPPSPEAADDATVQAIANHCPGNPAGRAGGKAALLLGGQALREPGLRAAARIAAHSGVKLFAEVFPTRLERGAGLPAVERIAYLAELAGVQLAGIEHLMLVDAKAPVSFFAYPGKKSYLVPDGCTVHQPGHARAGRRRQPGQARPGAGRRAGPARAAGPRSAPAARAASSPPQGVQGRGPPAARERHRHRRGHHLGADAAPFTAGAPRHDLITLTGGAIGQGLPNAVGAAIACPTARCWR
jgi:acetolactate synthase-1/2/3 large subunit